MPGTPVPADGEAVPAVPPPSSSERLDSRILHLVDEFAFLIDRVTLYTIVAERIAEDVAADDPASYSALTCATNDLTHWLDAFDEMLEAVHEAAKAGGARG